MIQKFKLNVWQILGIVLLLIGAALLIRKQTGVTPAAPVEPVAPPSSVLPSPTASTPIPTH